MSCALCKLNKETQINVNENKLKCLLLSNNHSHYIRLGLQVTVGGLNLKVTENFIYFGIRITKKNSLKFNVQIGISFNLVTN